MAILPAVFGDARQGKTPQQVQRERELADLLFSASQQERPMTHWAQALAKGLQGLGSGIAERRADSAESEGRLGAQAKFNARNDNGTLAYILTGGKPSMIDPSGLPKSDVSAELNASSPSRVDPVTGDTYSGFMDTVKGKVTNPFGLAAVAATGRAESGWDARKANSTWSDPSQSGQPGTSGGIMSWRGPRLEALNAYASANGQQPGAITPDMQAQFFLQENPQLIEQLNKAGSVEEAQRLMNNAWRFAGYDQPGGEAANRLGYAQSYLPKFQGGQEVASADPATSLSGAYNPDQASVQALSAQTPGYVDPAVSSVDGRAARAGTGAQATGEQKLAQMLTQPATGTQRQSGSSMDKLASIIADPWSTPEMKAVAEMEMRRNTQREDIAREEARRQQEWQRDDRIRAGDRQNALGDRETEWQRADRLRAEERAAGLADRTDERAYDQPVRDAQIKKAQIELQDAENGTWEKLGDGRLFNKRTGKTSEVPALSGTNGFRFSGSSVEAQSLNGLIDSGQITEDQAQQLGAGKTVTGPNGELMFLTPQGVFGNRGGQQQPAGGEIDIFGGAEPAATEGQPKATGDNGIMTLTEPKVTIDEKKAMTFADRMTTSGSLIDKFGKAGLDKGQVMRSNVPLVGNMIVSDEFQQFDQARRDFINAQLRRESGAVISPEEFDNANKQYFPQPGDLDSVLEQKRRNRQIAIDGMVRDSGPTYTPPVVEKAEPEIARPQTEEEFNALKAGTLYIDPEDGKQYRK